MKSAGITAGSRKGAHHRDGGGAPQLARMIRRSGNRFADKITRQN
jgi:hypothetical protein